MRDIEVYANVEPIGWDVGVSQPAKESKEQKSPDVIESKLDAILGQYEAK